MDDGAGQSRTSRVQRSPLAPHLVSASTLVAVVVLPLVVTAVVLTQRPWAPVLDMAMTELRVRDVGGANTPLIGLPGRIGTFPDQGSHPGPTSFYLLAPVYRLAGATAWGLELGSVVVNSVAVALIVWIGRRLAGTKGVLVMAAVAAVAVRGYGLNVLTHPWNPYFPVLLWLLVLVAAWAALAGDHWMAVVVVVAGSVAAQTHVPYLLNAFAICVLVLGTMLWRWRARPLDTAPLVRPLGRPLAWAIASGGALWLPPLVDQLVHDPGNVRRLVRHFASEPPEPAIGLTTGVEVFLRHLDAPSVLLDLVLRRDAFVHRSGLPEANWVLGALVLAAWIASAAFAHRRRHAPLIALHRVIAVALAVGAFSIMRIFGKVWYYLTLWAWGTLLLVVVAIVWTVTILIAERRGRRPDRATLAAAGIAIVLCTALSTGAVVGHEVPEHQMSDGLRAVVPATVAALESGVGPAAGSDARYVVFWQDAAYNGAQGYGLVNELERRGFEVGVHATWRVPVTPHRVFAEGTYDAEIHLVSGVFIDIWRQRPGYVEVIEFDRRSDDERARFEELRSQVGARLTELGRDDLQSVVDRNLFGASLDPDLPRDVVDDLSEMLQLSVPIAVFLAPPGSSA